MAFIYMLINTINGKGYVGQTRRHPIKRFKSHIKASNQTSRRPGLTNAIAKYGADSFELIILQSCSLDEMNSAEVFWIGYYNTMRPHGYNLLPGGHQRAIIPEQTRRTLSEAAKRRIPDPKTIEIISSYWRGRKQSPEHIEKRMVSLRGRKYPDRAYHAPNKGKHHTPEAKAKISAAHKAKKHSPEFVEKRIAPHRGMKRSAEARAKMSLAGLGKRIGVLNPSAKLTEDQVMELRHVADNGIYSKELAIIFNITKTHVDRILRGEVWGHNVCQRPRCRRGPTPRRKPLPCAVCGEPFFTADPRTKCCSRRCGFALRSQNKAIQNGVFVEQPLQSPALFLARSLLEKI